MKTIRFIRAIYMANKGLFETIGQAFLMATILALCVTFMYLFQ